MDASAKLAVHELLSRAAYGLDEHDIDLLGGCFAPDAEFHMQIAGQGPIPPFVGHAAIIGLFRGAMDAQTDKRRHLISNIFFTEEGAERCAVLSNLTLFGTENGTPRLICTALYRDRLALRDGRWFITERRIELDSSY
ncbi:MAG: nuclear transport factor 2 family protein [Gammaproteobacteria bacterium]